MIGQSLSNTNEKYYGIFSKTFCKLNLAYANLPNWHPGTASPAAPGLVENKNSNGVVVLSCLHSAVGGGTASYRTADRPFLTPEQPAE
jgi:hypothetical protein